MSTSPSEKQAVAILGAGPFGRALARVARRQGTEVVLWSRRPATVESLGLPDGVRRAATLGEAAKEARLLLLCAPALHARGLLRDLGDHVDGAHLLVHAARGFGAHGETVSDMVREETAIRRVGVLAGPLVPSELEAAMPSAIVVASRFPEVAGAARVALSQPALRVYASDDLMGVEMAAALMTVIALMAGVAAGLGGGVSTRALVVARGIAQSARVLEALGAKARTLAGLGGVGEVFVTASGVESPDYELGLAIARGGKPEEARAQLGRSAEGPDVARRVAKLCAERGLTAPIFSGVAALFDGKAQLDQGIRTLLGGPALAE